ncbi:MAG TPA: DUF2950 family protein [Candidatus Bathyarchaeia archaeon]|nr:DUF2950 family protein [Candidatus Bathyarchaeia archaeon]
MRVVSGWEHRARIAVCCGVTGAFFVMMLLLTACHRKSTAGQAAEGQQTYASPDEAAKALAQAAATDDRQQLQQLFGPAAKDILYSGDAAQDKADMADFAAAYAQMNRFRKLQNGSQLLLVGATNTAFPVPLREDRKARWYFDVPAGATELQVRRIGRNELAAIDIMASLADAQEEYFNQAHEGEKQYARKFISDPGKQNGLYWPEEPGKPKSPVGPLLAYATELGAQLKPSLHKPFHGYYFGILNTQGAFANGGLKDYMREGKMTRGFGFIAWPAEYGKSGTMSFIVNGDRIVYQKDLGTTTKDQAPFTTQFSPDSSWLRVEQ